MSAGRALLVLLLAALLEAGGDALVRTGRQSPGVARTVWFVAGAAVLFAYGYLVNAPGWDFGRLLGAYVACFFLVAQAIAWAAFGQKPSAAILAGGSLIVAGGLVITCWRR